MDNQNERNAPGSDRDMHDPSEHGKAQGRGPDAFDRDLHPDPLAGQNFGERTADREQELPTAYDVKEVHRSLSEFQDDDLKQIPVLRPGSRLQQGATYVDLSDPGRQTFTAMGGMSAGPENVYVPKDQVPYPLWNRLLGIDDPARTHEGNGGERG